MRRPTLLLVLPLLLVLRLPAQDRLFYDYLKISQPVLDSALRDGDAFGQGLCMAGDIDGDGIPDLVVGAPGDDTGGDNSGALWVLFMDDSLRVREMRKIAPGVGGFAGALTPGGGFGGRVEAVGDWNDDGVPDIAVGEPLGALGALVYGKVWLLLLRRDGSVAEHFEYGGRTPGLFRLLAKDRRFGTDLAWIGDLDGNGTDDLAVGAPDLPTRGSGSVWILLLERDGSLRSVTRIEPGEGGFGGGLAMGDQFGVAVESPGDFDGNGTWDLVAGAHMDDETGLNQGAIYLLTLGKDGRVRSQQKIVAGRAGFEGHIENDDRWGVSIATWGDLDRDGTPDLAVGSYSDDDGGKDKGAIYVLNLKPNGKVAAWHKISETTRNFAGQFPLRYQWALSLNPAGDLDRDGRPDLLVSGQSDDDGGTGRGSAWVLRPGDWPADPQRETQRDPGLLSREDSAMIYQGALTAADSARIDSLYDLSAYAPNNLVFLLDVSASMSHYDKLPLLRDAFVQLLAYVRPEDKISVITYSGKPTLLIDAMPASEREQIAARLTNLKSLGETKPGPALEMAYAQARLHFIQDGNNRIILATDGSFPMSEVDKPLEKLAATDVPLTVFFFGKQPAWKLDEMNQMARRGHGRAALLSQATVAGELLQEVKTIRRKDD
ncbi:MAG: hypothetical protein OHK0039_32320 [Bacteroidia bacterium]